MHSLPHAVGDVGHLAPGVMPSATRVPACPDELRPRPPHEGVVWLPTAMFRDRSLSGAPWAIAAHMASSVPRSSYRYWKTVDDIAEACGISASAVRQGIARLKAAGWLHQMTDIVHRKARTVYVLTWRMPDVPGHLPSIELDPPRRAWAPPVPAQNTARSAQYSAPPPAPPIEDESCNERATLTLTRACEGTGNPPSPGPDLRTPHVPQERPALADVALVVSIPVGSPGGLSGPSEDQIQSWLADLKRPRTPGIIRNVALWGLEDAGRLPDEFAGKVPPRLADPPPKPAALVLTQAPTPPRPLTTVELIERLADPSGPEAIAAAADKLAEEWGDQHSTLWHRKWMGEVAAGNLPKSIPLKLYRSLQNAHPVTRRKTFGQRMTEAMSAQKKPATRPTRQSFLVTGPNQPTCPASLNCTVVK